MNSTILNGWPVPYEYELTISGVHTYNPETHELVEKKEAKINRLNDELKQSKEELKYYDNLILKTSKEMSKRSELIDEIKKQLKELEE